MRSCALVPCLVLAGMLAGGPARAQDPSADDIIKSLTPGSGASTTRGIRVVQPAAEAPATPGHPSHHHPRAAGPATTAATEAPSVNLTVDFETNSAVLTPDAVHTLDHLGEALSSTQLATDRFRIEGHTDTVGSADANKALSERRAAAVVDYLVHYHHVDRARLTPVGMGEAGLLVPTGAGVAEPRNRRVEVINLG